MHMWDKFSCNSVVYARAMVFLPPLSFEMHFLPFGGYFIFPKFWNFWNYTIIFCSFKKQDWFIFCFENCSDLLREKIVPLINNVFLISLEQFISNSEGSEEFFEQNTGGFNQVETIKMLFGTNNWDVEKTYRNEFE